MTVVGPLAAVSDYQQVCNLSSPDTERTRTHLKRRLNWLVYFTLAVSYDSVWGETTEVNIYKDIHLSVLKPRDCGRLETTTASHPSISALSLKDTSYILSTGVRKSPFSPSVCGIYCWQVNKKQSVCKQPCVHNSTLSGRYNRKKKSCSSITLFPLRCQHTSFSSSTSLPIIQHQQSDSIPDRSSETLQSLNHLSK